MSECTCSHKLLFTGKCIYGQYIPSPKNRNGVFAGYGTSAKKSEWQKEKFPENIGTYGGTFGGLARDVTLSNSRMPYGIRKT